MLVRVFAVAEPELEWEVEAKSRKGFLLAVEKAGDGAVVGGSGREGLDGETFAQTAARAAALLSRCLRARRRNRRDR